MWSEVNSRVNYPIKAVLVEMVEKGQLHVDDPLHLFCTSWLTTNVCFVGIQLFLKSWNNLTIPGMLQSLKLLIVLSHTGQNSFKNIM